MAKQSLVHQSKKMNQSQNLTVASKNVRYQKSIDSMNAWWMKFFFNFSYTSSYTDETEIEFCMFLVHHSLSKGGKNSTWLWFWVEFVQLAKHSLLLRMEASKSIIKDTVKISWRVFCFLGFKNEYLRNKKKRIIQQDFFRHIVQEEHSNCNSILWCSCKRKTKINRRYML